LIISSQNSQKDLDNPLLLLQSGRNQKRALPGGYPGFPQLKQAIQDKEKMMRIPQTSIHNSNLRFGTLKVTLDTRNKKDVAVWSGTKQALQAIGADITESPVPSCTGRFKDITIEGPAPKHEAKDIAGAYVGNPKNVFFQKATAIERKIQEVLAQAGFKEIEVTPVDNRPWPTNFQGSGRYVSIPTPSFVRLQAVGRVMNELKDLI
jgi:hypothetical protein